ncbi:MAG: acetoacetate decarboxylase family protein [Methylobacteriaceae bacterium]|nr:acetoacetate decarboxylase family protein [Methylobacteriaceae bacterium]
MPAPQRRMSIADITRPGFATPWGAPSAPPFPFTFRNAEILTLVYRTDLEAIEALLPPPLEPTGEAVLIHIYKMNDTDWLGPYGEANVMVGAALPGTEIVGAYSPYLFLSSDGGIIQGREVHGQPKKLGEPRLEARGDLWVGTVVRNGIDVVTGTLAYKQRRDTLDALARAMPFAININLKAVDHIDGRPAIRQLTSRRLSDVVVHECWSGPCSVELRPNVQAPVFRLPVRDMLDGFYWRADFTLVAGSIIHDYLAGGASE